MSTNQSNTKQPRYEIQSIFNNGTKTPPQIVPVNKLLWEAIGMNRRSFLGVGLTAVAALSLSTCTDLVDPPPSEMTIEMENEFGEIVQTTLPCDSPIPTGAICTCNCVSRPSENGGGGSGGDVCVCNKICVCAPT